MKLTDSDGVPLASDGGALNPRPFEAMEEALEEHIDDRAVPILLEAIS